MKRTLLGLLVSILCVDAVIARDDERPITATGPSSTNSALQWADASEAILANALAKADLALARSVINPANTKHVAGEAFEALGIPYVQKTLQGSWRTLSPRPDGGRQGLDGLLLHLDNEGNPNQLIVVEAKYGKSTLGMTNDGMQMGARWTERRLAKVGNQYVRLASEIRSQAIQVSPVPAGFPANKLIPVPMPDGKTAFLWRQTTAQGTSWHVACAPEDASLVAGRAQKIGQFLQTSTNFPRLIIRGSEESGAISLTTLDARFVDTHVGNFSELPILRSEKIAMNGSLLQRARAVSQQELSQVLSRKLGLPKADSMELAGQMIFKMKGLESLKSLPLRTSLPVRVVGGGILAGMAGAIIDPILRTLFQTPGHDNPELLLTGAAASGVSTAMGAVTGQYATITIIKNPVLYARASAAASRLGFGTTRLFARAVGGGVGAGVAALALPWAEYALGLCESQDAFRQTVAGTTGLVAGGLAATGTMALIAAYGTASTGVAISELSGAAAASASLAWLGGGSVASGGLGVTGGTIIAGTGVGIIIVGVPIVIMCAYHYYDESQESTRLHLTIDNLKKRDNYPMQRGTRQMEYNQPAPS